MQAVPLDVIHHDLVQAADGLAGPVVASHATACSPGPDMGISHARLDIHVDARGGRWSDRVDVVLDVLDLVAVEHAHLECRVLVKGHRRRGSQGGASDRRLAAVGGIDQSRACRTRRHRQAHAAHIVAGGLAHHGIAQNAAVLAHMPPVDAFADVQVVAVTALHQGVTAGSAIACGTTHLQIQIASCALGLDNVTATTLTLREQGALVVDACRAAGLDAVIDLAGIHQVVLVEDTRRSRHGQDKGVGGHHVGLQAVVVAALARIVVVDKSHRVALVIGVCCQALVVEGAPRAAAKGRLHGILQRKVKHGGLDAAVLLGAVEPPAQRLGIAVPILAHRECRLAGLVIQARVIARIALAHVVAETVIAQFLHQVALIGLDIFLHIGAGVVQIAAAVKVFSLVGRAGSGIACCHTLVCAADVGHRPRHAVGLARDRASYRLTGQVHPAVLAALVIDDQVHDHAGVVTMQGRDHVTQLSLGAKHAVVLQPVHGHIAHGLSRAARIDAARVGHPHHVEVLSQLLRLVGQRGPACGLATVPIEALQHHATIHSRPAAARNGAASALACDSGGSARHVNRQRVGASRDAERHVHIHTQGVHRDGLPQHGRRHPEVSLAHRGHPVGLDAIPIAAAGSQARGKGEVTHRCILLAVLAVKGHRGRKQVTVGRRHRHPHTRVPTVALNLAQDIERVGGGTGRVSQSTGDNHQ